MSFEVNEKVIYSSNGKTGVFAFIVGPSESNNMTILNFWKIKLANSLEVISVPECEIIKIPKGVVFINLNMLHCTCGLKFVRDGGKHSSWCRVLEDK